MKEFKLMMEQLISGHYSAWDFSIDSETYLVDHYEQMMKEDPDKTSLLTEDVPDICAEFEPGADEAEFIRRIKQEYDRVFGNL